MEPSPQKTGPTAGGDGLGDADLQAGSGERLHDPPQVQAELPYAATRAAPREHERVRLCGIGLEVAEVRLGARPLLVPGLRGREARGEHRGHRRDPTRAARFPGRRASPAPTAPCHRLFLEASSAGCFRRRTAHFRRRRGDYVRRRCVMTSPQGLRTRSRETSEGLLWRHLVPVSVETGEGGHGSK